MSRKFLTCKVEVNVESSGPMSPEELRGKIRAASIAFTDEVVELFVQAFANLATQFKTGAVVAKPGPKKPAPKKAPAPKAKPAPKVKPVADKRNRRSADELDKVGDEVVKLHSSNKKGMRVEEINKALGTSTRELMRPIQKLLGMGKIKKAGERRATTYFGG